jgi:hypothetical protein
MPKSKTKSVCAQGAFSSILVLALLLSTANAAFEVTGARYRNSTDYRIHAASLMGGAEIFIDGKGMHDFPASNQVQFEFTNEEYANLGPIFNAPTVSEDDTFKSETIGGKLAFTVPSHEKITGIPLDQMW